MYIIYEVQINDNCLLKLFQNLVFINLTENFMVHGSYPSKINVQKNIGFLE